MNVTKNGITITISDAEVVKMALERLNDAPPTPAPVVLSISAIPRIGEVWEGEGGIYAGLARGRDGAADYHLIVGPEFDGQTDWDAAGKWATGLNLHGHSDFALPFRKEQALCFANVPELFKEEYYWSSEQHASGGYYAWGQLFSYGNQSGWGKDDRIRARAVRRLIIQ
jgi:hypothetical protein